MRKAPTVRKVNGVIRQTQQAQDRVAAFIAEHGLHENLYMPPLDVWPTDNRRVFAAVWKDSLAGVDYITHGFVCPVVGQYYDNRVTLFHAQTQLEAVEYLKQHKLRDPKRIARLFSRATQVTRRLLRSMGWCDPGINAWIRSNLADHQVKDDSIDVGVLWKVLNAMTDKDHYAQRLVDWLSTNPRCTAAEVDR